MGHVAPVPAENPAEHLDIEATEDGWTLSVALPGVTRDDLCVDVADRQLRIWTTDSDESRGFRYQLALPAEIDPAGVHASFDAGVLTVRVTRAEPRPSWRRGGREHLLEVGVVGTEELPPQDRDDHELTASNSRRS